MSDTQPRKKLWIAIVGIAVVALVTTGITALALNIMERKAEAGVPYTKVVNLDETTVDPAVWGQNFPEQYQSYLKTTEMVATTHAGSKKVEQKPTDKDPRTFVSSSRLEEDPRLKDMWAGYPFSVDYRHARGHAYMLEDQRLTLRVQEFKQPGTCLNCHASTVPIMDKLGNGDRQAGYTAMNQMPYAEANKLAEHPVGCIDCHDPATMKLRITRPAFIKGIAELKKSQGINNYDVNKDATNQEMRSFVCGQCHVEYYFQKETKELIFPWSKGIKIDQIWEYYQEDGHIDFVNAKTGAQIVKAQHPEFDIWNSSIHAANGVSCADCHMPYERVGARKVSSHHLQSPLLAVNQSCMSCHHATEQEMKDRVVGIQDRYMHSRDQAFDSLVQLIKAMEAAKKDGTATAEQLAEAGKFQNKASFYLDYVYSENSNGFHAPGYIHRILGDSLDSSRKGMLALKGVPTDSMQPSEVTETNTKGAKSRGN